MTDKAKLYAVKNEKGEWFDFYDEKFWPSEACIWTTNGNHEYANRIAFERGGHVVALVEKPEPEVVSQNEAKMLKEALKDDNYGAGLISDYVDEHWDDYGSLNRTHIQDRLMRAYANGYTVAKEKRYQLKVPYADGWIFQKYSPESKLKHHNRSDTFPVRNTGLIGRQLELTWFTAAEIQQYGLQDCEMNMWREG
ncbi:DUF1642 domain-containing protein [Lacticaseibacillus suibinensis]|uniref:DUF1642 domain-containing protein n=1 Tax=Lacticaseibacillus suibinensis TaxID=2486011 RepID=UPI0013DE4B53|nr:DUF1642 domain-containing protein [Lacticaseibacillus suibinensis]